MRIVNNDLPKLIGKFIVQINEEEDPDLSTVEDFDFWIEKRIYFISRVYLSETETSYIMNEFLGYSRMFNEVDFIEFFNYYVKGHRGHRLLTSKELDRLNKYIKERNY